MRNEFGQALRFTLLAMALFGGAYHLCLWGVGRVAFPEQADGGLIRRADGTAVGSRLIAQRFDRREYFRPRPSAVDYGAASAGGTNYGPSNPDLLQGVRQRLAAVTAEDDVPPGVVPSEMVTASGSGLDPHIPPAAATLQAERVARARGVAVDRVHELIRTHTERPTLGFLGRARVNVLALNLALDEAFGRVRPGLVDGVQVRSQSVRAADEGHER